MNNESEQKVSVIQLKYKTNIADSCPLLYEIELNNSCLDNITEESAKYIYEKLGQFLFPETA